MATRAREFLLIPVQERELRERENPLLELARKKGWIVMEEQKAPLILIVQRIRLNFRNELVKLTTKGRTGRRARTTDATATAVKILRAAYVNEKFSHRTFLISPLAWKTMPRSI